MVFAYSVLFKTNRSTQGRLGEQLGSFVLSPGTHKGHHVSRLLVWEQNLPLHSLLPMKFLFPEFPVLLRSTPARCEGCLAALLEMKCSKKWMMLGFVNVGSCCGLCTQVPKQMVQGCSHWAGEGAATDTDNPIPDAEEKRSYSISHSVSLPPPLSLILLSHSFSPAQSHCEEVRIKHFGRTSASAGGFLCFSISCLQPEVSSISLW